MLFNSLVFLLFLPLAFMAYWALARVGYRVQNVFILLASYVFYAWWDWRFLGLLVFSSLCDHLVGRAMGNTEHRGRRRDAAPPPAYLRQDEGVRARCRSFVTRAFMASAAISV